MKISTICDHIIRKRYFYGEGEFDGGTKMNDERIITLYWERNEQALHETQKKYGRYLYSIAYNIVNSDSDAKECENDTYLSAWNAIPPTKPQVFSAFLGKIIRNIALKKYRSNTAQKRGDGKEAMPIDELYECIPDNKSFDKSIESHELAEVLNSFLVSIPKTERRIFIFRYWYCDKISDICKQYGFTESKVKMILMRTREKLRAHLMEEGIFL